MTCLKRIFLSGLLCALAVVPFTVGTATANEQAASSVQAGELAHRGWGDGWGGGRWGGGYGGWGGGYGGYRGYSYGYSPYYYSSYYPYNYYSPYYYSYYGY